MSFSTLGLLAVTANVAACIAYVYRWRGHRRHESFTEDERGVFGALFAKLAPLRERSLRLKTERQRVYKTLKFLLNSTLLSGLMAMIFAVLHVLEAITA